MLSLEEETRSATLLMPKKGQEGLLFYKITPWDYDPKDETAISKSLKQLFMPREDERKKFEELVKNNIPFTVVNRHDIRSFYPILKDGKLKVILLIDTSRTVSNSYLISRNKFD